MNIPSNFIKESTKLLSRIRYSRAALPILTHVLATMDASGISLTITDLDRWLETRGDMPPIPCEPESFLIPPDAMKAMKRADKNTTIHVTCKGPLKRREIRVVLVSGGISVESSYPTLEASELPARPVLEEKKGEEVLIPAKTMENLAIVAGCASRDATRYVLNGILFTPDEGGRLVATDGRRLGCTPAVVPTTSFILPNATVSVLTHPEFTGSDASMLLQTVAENQWVSIRSGNHHLISRTIDGNYPSYRQVIPRDSPHLAIFSTDHRASVIKWLRGLPDQDSAVNLTWERKGHLTLTQRNLSDASAVMRAPVEIEGTPPPIAFAPCYLADGLEIGGTLCLSDELSPGIFRHPGGRFCVVMPKRVTIATARAIAA